MFLSLCFGVRGPIHKVYHLLVPNCACVVRPLHRSDFLGQVGGIWTCAHSSTSRAHTGLGAASRPWRSTFLSLALFELRPNQAWRVQRLGGRYTMCLLNVGVSMPQIHFRLNGSVAFYLYRFPTALVLVLYKFLDSNGYGSRCYRLGPQSHFRRIRWKPFWPLSQI